MDPALLYQFMRMDGETQRVVFYRISVDNRRNGKAACVCVHDKQKCIGEYALQ